MSRHRDVENKIYVGDLPSDASEKELESHFSSYGRLRNVWVARNPAGFAFVEYEDHRDAEDAVRGLDGTTMCGVRVRVEHSSGKVRPKPWLRGGYSRGRGGPRGGSRGGGGAGSGGKGFNPEDRCYECNERGHYAYDCRKRSGRSYRSRSRSRSRGRERSRSYERSERRRSSRRSPTYSRSRSRSPSKH